MAVDYGSLGFECGIVSTATAEEQAKELDQKLRRKFDIPKSAVVVEDVEGLKIGYSELAMHTKKAGKLISRIWSTNNGSYGYGLLTDGTFIHGALNINKDGWVSFS